MHAVGYELRAVDAEAETIGPSTPQVGRLAQRAVARARHVAQHAVEAQRGGACAGLPDLLLPRSAHLGGDHRRHRLVTMSAGERGA